MIWCRQLQLREDQLACLRNPNNDSIQEFNRCLEVPTYATWPHEGLSLGLSNPHSQNLNPFSGDITPAMRCEELTLAALNQHTNTDVQSKVGLASRFMSGYSAWLAQNSSLPRNINPQNLQAYRRILSRSLDQNTKALANVNNSDLLAYVSLIRFLTGGEGSFYDVSTASPHVVVHAVPSHLTLQVQPVQLVCAPAPAPTPPPNASYPWQYGVAGTLALGALVAGGASAYRSYQARNYTPASAQVFIDDLRLQYRGNTRVLAFLAGWEAQNENIRLTLEAGHASASTLPPSSASATATHIDSNPALQAQMSHIDSVYQTGFEAGVRAANTNHADTLREAQARIEALKASEAAVSRQLTEAERTIEETSRGLLERVEEVTRSLSDRHQGDLQSTRRALTDAILGVDESIKRHAADLHEHFKANMVDRFDAIRVQLDALIERAEQPMSTEGGEQTRGEGPYRAQLHQDPRILEELRQLRGSVVEVLADLRQLNYDALVRQYNQIQFDRLSSGHPDVLVAVQEETRPYPTGPTALVSEAAALEVVTSERAVCDAPSAVLERASEVLFAEATPPVSGPVAGSALDSYGPTLADAVRQNLQAGDFQGDGFDSMDFSDVGEEVRAELARRETSGGGGSSGETSIRSFLEEVVREGAEFSPERVEEGSFMRRMRGRLGR